MRIKRTQSRFNLIGTFVAYVTFIGSFIDLDLPIRYSCETLTYVWRDPLAMLMPEQPIIRFIHGLIHRLHRMI
jgi:hypothetical protein